MNSMPAPPIPWTVSSRPKATQQNAPVPAQTCSCAKTVALSCERGATLSTKITLTVTDPSTTPSVTSPVDLTGSTFQFTAKPTPETPDSDPATIIIDWQETTTPTQGFTWLVIAAETTYGMQTIAYAIQVRMLSPSGVVTPLLGGTLTITEPPASARGGGPIINPL